MFDDTEYRKAMDEAVVRFQNEMKKVRTGRAHPDMLANIKHFVILSGSII